jgi:hypothetical protein
VAGSESGGVMATTPNYGWVTPAPTDFVTDLPADFETFADAVDDTVKDLNPGTTAGDLDYYTSSTAKARLGIGTAGQVLTVNSGATAPQWSSPVSGSLTLLSTTNLSGTTTSVTGISGAYKHLYFEVEDPGSGAGNFVLDLRFNSSSSAIYQYVRIQSTGTATTAFADQSQIGLAVGNFVNNNDMLLSGIMYNYASSTTVKPVNVSMVVNDATNGWTARNFLGGFRSASAVTSLQVISNNSLDAGVLRIYGVQ